MRRPRPQRREPVVPLTVVGCVLAMLFSGCGGANSVSTSSQSTSASATHETPTITQPGAQPGSLAAIKQRLTAAGYSPEDREVSGNAVEDVEVDGVEIDSFRTAAAARAEYAAIRGVFRDHPGRGIARLLGTRLYWFGKERPLTSGERARYEKIVSIAEGGT